MYKIIELHEFDDDTMFDFCFHADKREIKEVFEVELAEKLEFLGGENE